MIHLSELPKRQVVYRVLTKDLPSISALANTGRGSIFRQTISQIIPEADGKCLMILEMQGSYPYLEMQWMGYPDKDRAVWHEPKQWPYESDK